MNDPYSDSQFQTRWREDMGDEDRTKIYLSIFKVIIVPNAFAFAVSRNGPSSSLSWVETAIFFSVFISLMSTWTIKQVLPVSFLLLLGLLSNHFMMSVLLTWQNLNYVENNHYCVITEHRNTTERSKSSELLYLLKKRMKKRVI